MIPRAKHLSPSQFLRSAIFGTYLGIGGILASGLLAAGRRGLGTFHQRSVMNIREAKQLKPFDTFQRPSTNGHDNGFRRYTVTTVSPEGFQATDQHGYVAHCRWADLSTKPFLKTAEKTDGPLPYDQILNRDVPAIRDLARNFARQGICAPIEVYYKRGMIAAASTATVDDLTDEGWIRTGITIPSDVPYDSYWQFLYQRLARVPLFA